MYREATPRSDDGGGLISLDLENEIPVDQAVPIGTKLQLRATINEASGTLYPKVFIQPQLYEVNTLIRSSNMGGAARGGPSYF